MYILVKISGRKKAFGLPPNATIAKFSSKKDIPIAEHKQEIRGEFLKGRYAKRSTETPNRIVKNMLNPMGEKRNLWHNKQKK